MDGTHSHCHCLPSEKIRGALSVSAALPPGAHLPDSRDPGGWGTGDLFNLETTTKRLWGWCLLASGCSGSPSPWPWAPRLAEATAHEARGHGALWTVQACPHPRGDVSPQMPGGKPAWSSLPLSGCGILVPGQAAPMMDGCPWRVPRPHAGLVPSTAEAAQSPGVASGLHRCPLTLWGHMWPPWGTGNLQVGAGPGGPGCGPGWDML